MIEITETVLEAEKNLAGIFAGIDKTAFINQKKVLTAFRQHKISDTHFNYSTGYGYNDKGRDALDLVWADVFESEAAFVRSNIVSGTHAITIGLFGLLRPGDVMLSVTGRPYDTLTGVIGLKKDTGDIGSLRDFGIIYEEIGLKNNKLDFCSAAEYIKTNKNIKTVFVQKSRGYCDRAALSSHEIGELVRLVKQIDPEIYVVADNCYGEFAEEHEPGFYGADMVIGSLIKNPGGGIAECGGYIAGTKKAVGLAAHRLTSPLVGTEAGASLGATKNIFKGLFFAPHVVAQSLKTACLAAYIYSSLGFEVSPKHDEKRFDIIQSIKFFDEHKMLRFIQGVQAGSAIDSHILPVPDDMPGYDCKVVMASGSFTQGSSIEISADAPVKPPYIAFLQGGLSYESGKLCIMKTLETVLC
ncbi:MAG: methionine gamma-lyase family protein [Oscillospiraceae bacterium]|nr:methionine gamma-lyase family protein [Oscillospiraceae bacterium]